MSVPYKNLIYFITNRYHKSVYVDYVGGLPVVKEQSLPVPLRSNPGGWEGTKINFGTNKNYWSLNRSFTTPMFMVNDGADICRFYDYKRRGYEEELYIVIMRMNPVNGHYELEFRGRLDIANAKDQPRKGVTINAIQGDLWSFVTANEDVAYPLALDASNADCHRIKFDGINLFDRLRYTTLNLDLQVIPPDLFYFTVPLYFQSNEGDSVGIVKGDQTFENISNFNTYVRDSSNCIFYDIRNNVCTVTGKIKFSVSWDASPFTQNVLLFFRTSNQTTGGISGPMKLLDVHATNGQTFEVDLNNVYALAPGEKLFLLGGIVGNAALHLTWHSIQTDVRFSYKTRNDISYAYALEPIKVLQGIVTQMTGGRYAADSNFFRANRTKLMTSSNAIRNYAFTYQYASIDTIVIGASYYIKIPGTLNVLPTDNEIVISDAGANNGKYSIIAVTQTVDLFTQIQVNEPVVNATFSGTIASIAVLSKSLKSFFKDYNVQECMAFKIVGDVLWMEPKGTIYNDSSQVMDVGEISELEIYKKTDLLFSNISIGYKSQDYRQRNGLYEYNTTTKFKMPIDSISGTLDLVSDARGDCFGAEFLRSVIFDKPTTDTTGDNQAWIINTDLSDEVEPNTYPVLRENYTSLYGVLDNTIFNAKDMTPHDLLKKWGPYIHSISSQLPADLIKFLQADKNSSLIRTIGGVTTSERQSETISQLGDILFYHFAAKFKTVVPLNYSKIFSSLGTGYVKGTFYGQPLYFLPIGEMSGSIGNNEPQEWDLILAPNNSLDAINNLSLEGLFSSDNMGNSVYTSDLNPIHLNKGNFVLPAKYHHRDIYDAQYQDRTEDFISKPQYAQKLQRNDGYYPFQFITRGVGVIDVKVFNHKNKPVFVSSATVVTDASVPLPYARQDYYFDPATVNEGFYYIVFYLSGVPVRFTEWLDIRNDHNKTLLFEYRHTWNKFNTYFTDAAGAFVPFKLRVEATLLPWYPDDTYVDYNDEFGGHELIDGIPYAKREIRIGNSYGVPDYMARKVGRILLLNRTNIENDRYSRSPASKMTPKKLDGHPMYSYNIEIMQANPRYGLSTNESGGTLDSDTMIAMTLDATGFGSSDPSAVIDIEVPNEP